MLDMKKYTSLARQIAAEGIVLLQNEKNVLYQLSLCLHSIHQSPPWLI